MSEGDDYTRHGSHSEELCPYRQTALHVAEVERRLDELHAALKDLWLHNRTIIEIGEAFHRLMYDKYGIEVWSEFEVP